MIVTFAKVVVDFLIDDSGAGVETDAHLQQ